MSELPNLDPQGRDVEGAHTPRNHQPSNLDEISEAWEQFPEGYPRFAAFIAHDVDKSTMICRRFERLAARNLLYLESELFELEAKQDKLDEDDRNDPQRRRDLRKWEPARIRREASQIATVGQASAASSTETEASLAESPDGAVATAWQERLEVAFTIRKAIKEYYKALKLYREILSLDNPNPQALRSAKLILNNQLFNDKGPSSILEGRMASRLDSKYKNDLCLVGPTIQQDDLTTLVEQQLGVLFRDSKYPHRNIALMRFPRRYIQTVVAAIGLILFVSMFIGSLFLLYFLRTRIIKLAMISCMTFFLTMSMAVFTRSSRVEIFAAVIGYLLITTVFVGSSSYYDEPSYLDNYYPVVQPSVPDSSSGNTTSTISTLRLTTIAILAPAATSTVPSNQQPSAALGNSANIATIAGTVIAALAFLLSVVAGIYQCRKWAKNRRSKKLSTL
ncbi:hypothetical protein BKA61DRAFT_605764 [Leptodontidium sp. MPI-SDFR-AT-0119]|nr:hypothetical protein BKA61DRAFT_605764 [Leptodontidium sp. MPI-SDFR-AT-0119]